MSDRTGWRSPFLVLNSVLGIVGLPMVSYCTSSKVRYVGVFITLMGSAGNIPAILAFVSSTPGVGFDVVLTRHDRLATMSSVNRRKRSPSPSCMHVATPAIPSLTLSFSVGFGGLGGIIGSLVFRQQDAPNYVPGFICAITSQVLILVITVALAVYFHFRNKKAEQGGRLCEGTPGFFYTL